MNGIIQRLSRLEEPLEITCKRRVKPGGKWEYTVTFEFAWHMVWGIYSTEEYIADWNQPEFWRKCKLKGNWLMLPGGDRFMVFWRELSRHAVMANELKIIREDIVQRTRLQTQQGVEQAKKLKKVMDRQKAGPKAWRTPESEPRARGK